jgi:hypothetical protein
MAEAAIKHTCIVYRKRGRASISTGQGSGGRLPLQHRFLRRLIEVNLAVNVLDPINRDEMTMTAGFRVVFGQDDSIVTFLMVDRANMFAVRSNHFHLFVTFFRPQTFEFSARSASNKRPRQIGTAISG